MAEVQSTADLSARSTRVSYRTDYVPKRHDINRLCDMVRSEDDHAVAKNIAVAGMAALLFAGQPQTALAKDAATSSQVQSTPARTHITGLRNGRAPALHERHLAMLGCSVGHA